MEIFAIETHNLNYSYKKGQPILIDLNLQVPQGSIYCFLGQNGAGKTTTLKILLGLLRSFKPAIRIFDKDHWFERVSIARKVGSLIEQPSLYLHLTGIENLEIFRLSHQVPRKRISEVLDITGIAYAGNKPVRDYSLGMKQRLGIAIALIGDPDLLVLDEPTNGLDPQGIIEIRELLKVLNKDFRKTILVSSHLLSEVEKIATHFGILHKGQMKFQGSAASLAEPDTKPSFVLEIDDSDRAMTLLRNSFSVKKISGTTIEIRDLERMEAPLIINQLTLQEVKIFHAGFVQRTLEDIFIQLTQ